MSYHFPRLAISEGIPLNLAMDCFGPSLDFLVFNVSFHHCFCPYVTDFLQKKRSKYLAVSNKCLIFALHKICNIKHVMEVRHYGTIE